MHKRQKKFAKNLDNGIYECYNHLNSKTDEKE